MKKINKKPNLFDEKSILEKFHVDTKIEKFDKKELNPNKIPLTWKKVHFKTYPRFKKIDLDIDSVNLDLPFLKVLLKRKSQRNFKSVELDSEEIGNLLYYSAGIIPNNKQIDEATRFYPSAGARYPLEVYLLSNKIKGFQKGIYHYNVKNNVLEFMWRENRFPKLFFEITDWDWSEKASALIAISSVFRRTQIKYGDRSYRHVLIESGHLAQNIYLVSTALGLKCCSIGGFVDDKINKLLDFDDEQEIVTYLIAIGK